ncbi:MAG: FAD-dependent oxidoreductase [Burkholderiales bacterium]|nr:FAD-dependent oxidoreductase [Burkholderiales bacterium]MDE2456344.1 FAD-dependent oxidoreductase [Burkholderiales bacterium]
MSDEFDLVTIGAGSGGVAASRRAAAHGAKVAIIEARRVGGTCVLRGCVPKKLLMYAAQFGDAFAESRGYGWSLDSAPRFEMARWAAAKAAETARLEGVYRQLLAGSGVELVEGRGRIVGSGIVEVGKRILKARHILVATGGAPVIDSIPGIEACATSDDLLDLQELPASAAVIGSGFIAAEFASMLARLGAKVTMAYRAELPLRGFDEMLRRAAAELLNAAGVELLPHAAPKAVRRTAGGFELEFARGTREFPWVLNATGRRPNSAGLGPLAIGPDGAVKVDEHLRTSVERVWAIGDVTNRKNLTPVAIAEGRALADSLFGPTPRQVDLGRVASAVFTIPPLASIGPTEEEAVAAGHGLKVFEADFRPMKTAFVGGSERTRMKLLVDAANDCVLAVSMAGTDAPEIVQSLAVALSAGATKADFDRTIAVHPTAAEEFVLMREVTRRQVAKEPEPSLGEP